MLYKWCDSGNILYRIINHQYCRMQRRMQTTESSQLEQIVTEFQQVLFPSYLPGISSEDVILKYNRLKEDLERIDAASSGNQIPHEFKEQLLNELIRLLNEGCSFTHRVQISNMILDLVRKLKYNLAHLAVGRMPIVISQWKDQIPVRKLTEYKEVIKQKKYSDSQRTITIYFDRIYQEQRRIPNIDHLLISYPKLLTAKIQFENTFLNNSEYVIPIDQKLYLGIIAASTYGCRYLWNLLVKRFLNSGGNINWITEGISSNTIPSSIKTLAHLSQILAYKFQLIITQDFFLNHITDKNLDHMFIIQGLYTLAYFQCLSCFSQVNGLLPESNQLTDIYLSKNITKPSPQSFDAMVHRQYKQQVFEQEKAIDFVDIFNTMEYQNQDEIENTKIKVKKKTNKFQLWQNSDEDEELRPNQRKRIVSQQNIDLQLQQYLKENSLTALEEDQAQNQKLKNLKTLQNIKTIYNRFTSNKQTVLSNYTNNSTITSKLFKKHLQSPQIDQNSQNSSPTIIYSSDWRFQSDGLQAIQQSLDKNFANDLKHLIEALRSNSKKSKDMQIYYEMLHNYLYECVDYPTLMTQQLTSLDKNLVKLVTKSPFLFNKESFTKMRNQLKLSVDQMQERIMDIVSYKLELDTSMIALMLTKFKKDQQ